MIKTPNSTSGPPPTISFKPTDAYIPRSVEQLFPEESKLFHKLQQKEKQLDVVINRKLLDLQDQQTTQNNSALTGDEDGLEILRIYIYNVAENQMWQPNSNGEPSWTMRVEGRLLSDKEFKFSSFMSSISVELFGYMPLGQDGNNVIEWHADLNETDKEKAPATFDGVDIKRPGSSVPGIPGGEVSCEIVIQPKAFPIKLQVLSGDLADLVGCQEITQHDCFIKIFNYVKINNLLEVSQEPHVNKAQNVCVKCDELLFKIFKVERLGVAQVLEIISSTLLKPVEPIKVNHKINTNVSTTLGDLIIDLRVDPNLLDRTPDNSFSELLQDQAPMQQVAQLNEKMALSMQLLQYHKIRYDFYKGIAENPVEFLKKLNDKNSEYLKILCSDSINTGENDLIDEEIVRRSDYYSDELLEEYINLLYNSGNI